MKNAVEEQIDNEKEIEDDLEQLRKERSGIKIYVDQALINLGFTTKLKFGMRAELRKLCSTYLRYSYLIDLIATDSLVNCYIKTLQGCVDHIETLRQVQTNKLIPKPKLYQDPGFTEEEIPEQTLGT